MDIQLIIVLLLFAVALFYVGKMIYTSVKPAKNGCGSGCKCDFNTTNTLNQSAGKA